MPREIAYGQHCKFFIFETRPLSFLQNSSTSPPSLSWLMVPMLINSRLEKFSSSYIFPSLSSFGIWSIVSVLTLTFIFFFLSHCSSLSLGLHLSRTSELEDSSLNRDSQWLSDLPKVTQAASGPVRPVWWANLSSSSCCLRCIRIFPQQNWVRRPESLQGQAHDFNLHLQQMTAKSILHPKSFPELSFTFLTACWTSSINCPANT